MSIKQLLRIMWARKWLVLALAVLVSAVGAAVTLHMPKQYTAETSMVVEMKVDPALGALAPALAGARLHGDAGRDHPQRAGRVAGGQDARRRALAVGGAAVAEATKAKIPLERYFANLLQGGVGVEPLNGSNIINIRFSAQDPIFAQAAANAFAQAFMDVSVELRIAPTRQAWPSSTSNPSSCATTSRRPRPKLSKSSRTRASSSPTSASTRKTPATRAWSRS